jgi:hypothetical protein
MRLTIDQAFAIHSLGPLGETVPASQAFGTHHQEAREIAEVRARLERWVESTNERRSAMGRCGVKAEILKG